jgi:hypothetical protein
MIYHKVCNKSNTTGATSREGTAHSSEVTQRVLLVDKELPTRQEELSTYPLTVNQIMMATVYIRRR